MMNIFVGIVAKAKPEIFESEKEPNKDTHPQFEIIFGPFENREDAERYIKAMDQGVACGEG